MNNSSGYVGNFESWVEFLSGWAELKKTPIHINEKFSKDEFFDKFPFVAPNSLIHFYAAHAYIGFPRLLSIPGAGCLRLLHPDDVEILMFKEIKKINIMKILEAEDDELPVPALISKACYRDDYHVNQSPYVPFKSNLASYLIADADFCEKKYYMVVNPLVRFDDGEWEASIMCIEEPGVHRYKSFAGLLVENFIINCFFNDCEYYPDWVDSRNDPSGLSRLIIE